MEAPVAVWRDPECALLCHFDVVGKEALGGKALPCLEIGAKERRKGWVVLFGPGKFTDFRKASGAAVGLAKGKR